MASSNGDVLRSVSSSEANDSAKHSQRAQYQARAAKSEGALYCEGRGEDDGELASHPTQAAQFNRHLRRTVLLI